MQLQRSSTALVSPLRQAPRRSPVVTRLTDDEHPVEMVVEARKRLEKAGADSKTAATMAENFSSWGKNTGLVNTLAGVNSKMAAKEDIAAAEARIVKAIHEMMSRRAWA